MSAVSDLYIAIAIVCLRVQSKAQGNTETHVQQRGTCSKQI